MTTLVHELLDASADGRPDAAALVLDGARVTYQALAEESNRVARWLLAEGVRRGDRVALYLPKSAAAVAALYGILKAGAAYVPLDFSAPGRRVAFILRDCGVRHLVTSSRSLDTLLRLPAELLPLLSVLVTDTWSADRPSPHRITPWAAIRELPGCRPPSAGGVDREDLAYILYTSGSTGEPKGVAITHRASLAFVQWAVETLGLRGDDCLSNHAPYHFDLSVLDLFGAAAVGASVVPIPEGLAPFPMRLAELIDRQQVSVWYSVPSALIQLLTAGRMERFAFTRLRLVLFAGEVFQVRFLRDLMSRLPTASFWNLYGPTETNVCTYYQVPPLPSDRVLPIPIGRACSHADVFAVTDAGHVAGVGEVGELLVGGPSLMSGYWGRPDRTAEVLVPDPRRPLQSARVYRTGDLVRLDPDGTYGFLGRRDQVVKSRGYRIELGEVEAALLDHPEVREAAVVAIPDEIVGHRLRAVVVPRGERSPTEREIQGHCAERLPRYMIPEQVEFRAALPRTSNGKVDRRALAGESARGEGAAADGGRRRS